jgi:hypothetical protein
MEQLAACFFVFGGEEESEEKKFWGSAKQQLWTRIKVEAVAGRE